MERFKEKYTVVEVAVKLKEGFDENFEDALSYQLEEMSMGGDENTAKFDQVNLFTTETGWLVNFLGPSHEFKEIEDAVASFLNEFQKELQSDEFKEDWVTALESESVPQIDTFKVLVTRPYVA